ncbi:MAG: sigma-70 family RNA polymerase sigma factor [Candidatus Hydrogenedentes bacterium]|nr:sigma-70 family RNA polymerase sigma factor [Candidatus Hydrogenedentota bacterium]
MPWFRTATSDAAVVQRVRAGKRDEFAALVDRYLPVAYAVCYAQLHNATDAEDAAQDAFVKAYEALDGLKEPTKFGPWLLSIVRNICRNHKRSRAREAERVDALAILGQPPSAKPEDQEIRNVVRQQVDGLDDIHREVLLLHYYGGRSIKEIAALLELSQDAVKKRLQRAREALSAQMLRHLEPAVAPARNHRDGVKAIMGLLAGATAAWETSAAAASGAAAGVGAAGVAGGIASGAITKIIAGAAVVLAVTGAVVYWQAPPDPPALVVSQATPIAQNATADATPAQNTPSNPSDPPNPSDSSSTPPAVPQSGYFIRGRTVDQAGNPVPNASLTLDPYDPKRGKQQEAESGEDGWFIFTGLMQARYMVRATTKGLLGLRETESTTAEKQDDHEMAMLPAGAIAGMVRGKSGEPVPDAVVTLKFGRWNGQRGPVIPRWQELRAVKTDAEGRFELAPVWLGTWTLQVDSPNHILHETEALPVDHPPVTITLTPGAHVAGRVVYAGSDTPVPDVKLELDIGRSSVTGPDGNFVLNGVRPGMSDLNVKHHTLISVSKGFMIPEGGNLTGVTVEVIQGGIITGRIYDAQTGEGISPAWVEVEGEIYRHEMGDSNDGENGRYEITRLRPDTYHVTRIRGPQAYLNSHNPVHDPLHLELGQTIKGIDFGLTKGVTMCGTVHTSAEVDLESLMVHIDSASGANKGLPGYSRSCGTGGREDFTLSGLAPGETVAIHASAAGWLSETLGPLTIGPDGLEGISLTLRKMPTGSVSGKVVYGGGRPAAGQRVLLVGGGARTSVAVETDAEGAFFFESVAANVYHLSVDGAGMHDLETLPAVVVAAGQAVTGLVIDLGGGVGTISGRIVDDSGAPVVGAQIRASGSGGPQPPSDKDGSFTVHGIERSQCDLIIQARGYAEQRIEDISTGTTELRVVMERIGSVQGRVIDGRTGQPVPEFEVAVTAPEVFERENGANLRYTRFVNDTGVFGVDNLSPGVYVVTARAAGLFPASAESVMVSGQATTVPDLVLGPGADVHVTVVNSQGQPLPDAAVYANNWPDLSTQLRPDKVSAQTGLDGHCTLENLVPGSNLIYVSHADYVPSQYSLDIQAGMSLSKTFTLSEGGVLEGVVTDRGKVVPGRNVALHYTDANLSGFEHFHTDTTTDEQGRYRFADLITGQVMVSAHYGMRALQRSIAVTQAQTTRADFELASGDAVVSGAVRAPSATFDDSEKIAVLTIEGPGGLIRYDSEVGEDGHFTFRDVPPGLAELTVVGMTADQREIAKKVTLAIPPSGKISHDFDLGLGATVQGKISPRTDLPALYAFLIAGSVELDMANPVTLHSTLNARAVGRTPVDPSGDFRFDAVDPGEYTLIVRSSGLRQITQTPVTVPEGKSLVNVDLALP